jgi:threonine/homoserine/homoserine lactone efflux protein
VTAWEALLVGFGLGVSLAAPPGPVMAKMAHETARGRWPQGLLVGLGATSADAVYFVAVAFGLLNVLPDARILGLLALLGVALMLYFAHGAWRTARRPLAPPPRLRVNGWPAGFLLALTSPFNVAWWVTSGAPYLHEYGPGLGAGFFTALLATVLASVWVFHQGARRIRRFESVVSYASAVLLAGFAVLLAWKGIGFLTTG